MLYRKNKDFAFLLGSYNSANMDFDFDAMVRKLVREKTPEKYKNMVPDIVDFQISEERSGNKIVLGVAYSKAEEKPVLEKTMGELVRPQ